MQDAHIVLRKSIYCLWMLISRCLTPHFKGRRHSIRVSVTLRRGVTVLMRGKTP